MKTQMEGGVSPFECRAASPPAMAGRDQPGQAPAQRMEGFRLREADPPPILGKSSACQSRVARATATAQRACSSGG